jgi:hypothetical protein
LDQAVLWRLFQGNAIRKISRRCVVIGLNLLGEQECAESMAAIKCLLIRVLPPN